MILVVTITLSDGGKVIYEMDQSICTQRVKFMDRELNLKDWLTIYHIDSSKIHEFINEDDKIDHHVRKVLQINGWQFEREFYDSLESFTIGDFQGKQFIHEIPVGKVSTGQYYIQIKELADLYPLEKIKYKFPVIDDYYISAFMDASGLGNDALIRPVNVTVEWKNSFSDYVKKCIETIEKE